MAQAYDPSMIKSKLGWSNAFAPDGAFPLDNRVYFGSYEAAQEAAQTAVEFGSTESNIHFGMQLFVFDGTTATAYLIQGDKSLKEIGSGSSNLVVVEDEEAMLALQDVKVGQQVFRKDLGTIWVLIAEDASQLQNWQEAAKSNETIWTESQKKVIFSSITQQVYDGVGQKNADTLYFITDTRKIYKGDVDVTSSVIVGEIPEVGSAIKGKLYISPTSLEAKVTTDGASFITMSPGYLTDGANWSSADSNKLATIGLIKKGIQETLSGINTNASFRKEDGTLTVGSGTPTTLTGVAHDIKYESAQLKITIPVYGGPDVVVNIPKDKFVTAGKYYKDYPEEEPTQHNVIVLTIDSQDEPVIIPAEGLVDVFTGGSTDNITVTVSDSNQITATAIIDPVEGNALVSSATGLKVDVSNKLNTYGSGNASEILLSDAEGNVPSRSGVSIISGTGPMGNEDTKIPTAKLIAEAITAAVNSSISSKVDKVVGTEDNLVAFAAGGAIKDSGKKVGGATLSESPNENTVATELAVSSAFSWKTLD